MKSLILILTCFFISLFGAVAQAADPLVLYDNFNGKVLNPRKWYGAENQTGNQAREVERQISSKRLNMALRVYNDSDSSESIQSSQNLLYFTRHQALTSIKARVVVDQYDFNGCSDKDYSYGMARIKGYFFNASTPEEGSYKDDVNAEIRVQGYSNDPGVLDVIAKVERCKDDMCYDTEMLYWKTLGSVQAGEAVPLRVRWDKPNHRFVFYHNHKTYIYSYKGILSDERLASHSNNKRLDITIVTRTCSDNVISNGFLDVYFDDVYVNQGALQ